MALQRPAGGWGLVSVGKGSSDPLERDGAATEGSIPHRLLLNCPNFLKFMPGLGGLGSGVWCCVLFLEVWFASRVA